MIEGDFKCLGTTEEDFQCLETTEGDFKCLGMTEGEFKCLGTTEEDFQCLETTEGDFKCLGMTEGEFKCLGTTEGDFVRVGDQIPAFGTYQYPGNLTKQIKKISFGFDELDSKYEKYQRFHRCLSQILFVTHF